MGKRNVCILSTITIIMFINLNVKIVGKKPALNFNSLGYLL